MPYPHHLETISPKNLSVHSEETHRTSKNEYFNPKDKFDCYHLDSPTNQVNLTAQQHFNNQTLHCYSGQNLTFQENNSRSLSRKSRSLQSPGIQREFSQLDSFLKQTYEKHGIYELIRSFVDMEDKLVSTFQNIRTTLENKNHDESSSKLKVRCFEEINEVDEFSFQAQENIIHQFLYNLQNFFISSDTLGIIQNEESESEKKPNDFSFSQTKPQFERSIIATKRSHIHNSRSKYAIGGGLKSKREMFSDQKMIKSINILNKPMTPLKFEELSLNKISEGSFKMTNSEMMGEESIERENMMGNGSQEELLKTIFELRQQILVLKQERYNQNGTYSHNSSFYFDRSIGEHNFRSKELQNTAKQDSSFLEMLKEKSSFKLLNDYEAKIKDDEKITLKSSTHPIVIKEDDENEDSSRLSEGNDSFRFSFLEKVEVEEDKENNPNLVNSQNYAHSKTTKLQKLSKQQIRPTKNYKKCQIIESNVVRIMYSPQSNSSFFKNQVELKEKYITEEHLKVLLRNFMDEFVRKFKSMFKVEMEIELILLNFIRKRKAVDRKIYESFSELIDWYSNLRIQENSMQESVDKFVSDCVSKKVQILQDLKKMDENR